MDCQTIFHISRTVEERKSVLCILRAHEGKDLAYVEIRCAGKTGDCKGDMTWVAELLSADSVSLSITQEWLQIS